MRFQLLSLAALGAVVDGVYGSPVTPRGVDLISRGDAGSQLKNMIQQANAKVQQEVDDNTKRGTTSGCTSKNLQVRKEWGQLTNQERINYTNAVLCLQSKPALTPSSVAAGAKTRFDDFVATHINQTLTIHYTGNFLSWHRYFTWLYEQALQKECGYTGTQPYWDWGLTAITGMTKSPIMDGSATSMSGNGAPVPNQPENITLTFGDLPPLYLPTGEGGGCVTSGPFKDMSVNLGPAALALPGGATQSAANPLDYNPRCLKRDLTDAINKKFGNYTDIINLITQNDNIADFQLVMQGVPGSGSIGVHGGGHYAMGGDPGRDVFVSPGEPLFYVHHGMIDLVWWIWQLLDPATRMQGPTSIAGTRTFANEPPSANATLQDYNEYGYAAGPPMQIEDLLSTTAGPFCYVYV